MDIDRLIAACLAGDKRATSRLISLVEWDADRAEDILERTYPHADEAFYIGITGPPGSGKSTLVDRLTRCFCANGHSVGIIAVDPCSPFSGGALLGDRIRMNASADRPDVFFRSMSAGRALGGLSRAARDASRILAASGRKVIMIETVGVGQSELDIAQATDSVVVV
ncbi:MAG: ATP/GTP-binding protein, partial [Desulfobacterales bacterium]|nr:ATP/GTP-binding protein [Desulfobacterales bacterium]